MRIAILTRQDYRSPRFLAEGLARMLAKLGFSYDCFPMALGMLDAISERSSSRKNRLKATVADLYFLFKKLERYDLIVVSDAVGVFGRTKSLDPLVALNKPILHYEVFAYQGSEYWIRQFGQLAHNVFDGFLTVSGIHDSQPLEDRPIFEIGMDLPIPHKFDYQRPFLALLDFPRKGYELERQIQKEALQFLDIPIIELDSEYTFQEIDAIYSRVGIAFVAFPEAFGLPITQLQYHGAYIATPQLSWVKRHALRPKHHVFDPDLDRNAFTDNFITYDSKEALIEKLSDLKQNFNPWQARKTLLAHQANLVHGNLEELSEALRHFA